MNSADNNFYRRERMGTKQSPIYNTSFSPNNYQQRDSDIYSFSQSKSGNSWNMQMNSNYHGRLPSISRYRAIPYEDSRRNMNYRSDDEQEKTEAYLKNCEDIIRNLRQMKDKKKRVSDPHISSVQRHEKQRGYPYSKNYASSGSAYNKNIQFYGPISDKMHSPGQLQISRPKEGIRHLYEQPYRQRQIQPREDRRNPRQQKQKQKYSQQSQFQARRYEKNERYMKNPEKEVQNEKTGRFNKDKEQQAKIQPHRPIKEERYLDTQQQKQSQVTPLQKGQVNMKRQQLSECLIELTKYLRMQNERPYPLPEKNNQIKKQNRTLGKQMQKQIKVKVLKKQKETSEQRQARHQAKLQELKNKALQALRQINQRSQSFVGKIKEAFPFNTKSLQSSVLKNPNRIHYQQQNIIEKKPSAKVLKTSPKAKEKSVRIHEQQKNERKQWKKESQAQNQDLVKLMLYHLEKQDGHNYEMSYCLKQLTQYIRNQNQEMEDLKESRKNERPFRNEKTKTNQGKGNNQNQKRDTAKFQQAVLKRLKKTRLRGSIFQEKVQKFKNSHKMQSKDPPIESPNPQQPSPPPATDNPLPV